MPESQTNSHNRDALQRYLGAIDGEDDELATLKDEYIERCKGPRERIRDVVKAAEENGVNVVAFRALLKKHRSDRRQERRVAELEPDDALSYEMMVGALGDFGSTELGQAALNRAKPRQDGDETLNTFG